MAVINHAKREINAKIVYYGPAGAGKASLFRYVHQRIKPNLCGPLKTMPAGGDNLLFFEYLPFEHTSLDGYQIRFHLYTLTGHVTNPGTWKMILKGVDGLAVIAEAGHEQSTITQQSLRTLQTALANHGRELRQIPCVLISSKADCHGQCEAGWGTDLAGIPMVRSSVQTGEGVLQALAVLSQAVVQQLREKQTEAPAATERSSAGGLVVAGDLPLDKTDTIELHDAPSASRQAPIVLDGQTNTLQVPLTLSVAGEPRNFMLRVTLNLEEVGDGAHGV